MPDDATTNQQPPTPAPDLKSLDRLVGTWQVAGGTQGQVTYEWMEGGILLLQHVDLEQYGQQIKGIEIITRSSSVWSALRWSNRRRP